MRSDRSPVQRILFLLAVPFVPFVILPLSTLAGDAASSGYKAGKNLALADAVDTALASNPDILKSRQEIERTTGQFLEVRSQILPRAAVVGNSGAQDRGLQSSGGFGSLVGNQDKSWRIALEGRQLLYSGGQVRAALRIAKSTEESAIYQLQDTIDRVIAQTRKQYYTIILNEALIAVNEESITLLQEELDEQKARFDAGTVPRFNVLRAEVELANARPDLIRSRNDFRIAQLDLARTLGQDTSGITSATMLPYKVTGKLDIPPVKVDVAESVRVAKERRPFLKAQRQNIIIQADQVRVALAEYQPRLEATGGYEYRNDPYVDDIFTALNGWFVGIEGSWKIFDGLETAGKAKQARAQLESAKIVYEDSVRQVEIEVQTALSRLLEALELIESQSKNVEQAKEALRLARERFSAGAGTQLDILDARVALTQAQTTELQARFDYNVAIADFDLSTGLATGYDERFDDPMVNARKKGTKHANP